MWGIVSGNTYGYPSDHAIFMNTIVTVPLRLLYSLSQSVPWYAITFYSLHALAVCALIVIVKNAAAGRLRVAFAAGCATAGLVTPLIVHYQFTATSILMTGAGVIACTGWVASPDATSVDGGWSRLAERLAWGNSSAPMARPPQS